MLKQHPQIWRYPPAQFPIFQASAMLQPGEFVKYAQIQGNPLGNPQDLTPEGRCIRDPGNVP
jgi:hypothetical protein